MKQLWATKPLTEFDRLLKTFKQTHESADLEKLLSYCCQHLDIRHFIAINWFLFDIKEEKYIKQEAHTKLLYSFALLMMPLVWYKENKSGSPPSLLTQKIKLSIHQMLEISRSCIISRRLMLSEENFYPQRTFDHLYWSSVYSASPLINTFKRFFFFLANLIPKILRNPVTDEYLFLKLWIASLYHCLDYSNHLFICSNLKLNQFKMSKFFFDDAHRLLFSESLDSGQLDQFLKKMPGIIHPGNLSITNSLLSDKILTYQRWGHPTRVTVPINQPCGKVIRKILHRKFIPMVIQYQSTALEAIIQSLPALFWVLIPLIYQYYNEIKFLELKIIFNKQTIRNQFELFYHAEKTAMPMLAPMCSIETTNRLQG